MTAPAPMLPEVPVAVLLPVIAALVFLVLWAVRRRRTPKD